jgi:hypothetical protein
MLSKIKNIDPTTKIFIRVLATHVVIAVVTIVVAKKLSETSEA